MADETDEKVEEKPVENETDKPGEKKNGGSIVPWIIIAAVVAVAAGAGLGLGVLFAGGGNSETETDPTADQPAVEQKPQADPDAVTPEETWYFDLEPVVANLNEPGATRYVRAALTLEVSGEISVEEGTALLEQKKPLLTNVLTIYLAGLSVETTRGDTNLKRIQAEIGDAFNERLFPGKKPLIKGILIKEFAVQ